MEPIKRNPYRV